MVRVRINRYVGVHVSYHTTITAFTPVNVFLLLPVLVLTNIYITHTL